MEIVAQSKNVRISPRKVRMVAAAVKKLSVERAIIQLGFMSKAAAEPVLKTLKSAIANATVAGKIKSEDLKIKNILIDEGLKMKRRDTSHGARYGGGVIQKRASHIKVILEG